MPTVSATGSSTSTGPGVAPAEVARLAGGARQQRFVLRVERADRGCDAPSGALRRRRRSRADAAVRRQGRGHKRLFPRSRRLADGIHLLRARSCEAAAAGSARASTIRPCCRPIFRCRTMTARRGISPGGALPDLPLPATRSGAFNRVGARRPHRSLHLSAHRRSRRRFAARLGRHSRARAAARRNPAASATILPSSRRSASLTFSASRPRTRIISAKPPSGCICRLRLLSDAELKFTPRARSADLHASPA